MAYEIPQKLEYHEKIMFGLTFSQLGYFFGFGAVGLFLFFKLPLSVVVIIDSLLAFLAVLFMFFDLGTKIRDYFAWRKFRDAYGTYKIKKFFSFKEIKKDFIITNNKKVAVIKITPINFSIKSSGVQESIIGIFQKFLNSIEFPIQIVMNTDTIDLKDYFKDMTLRNKDYADLFASHKKFLESVVSNKGIMNRSFYIVIPELHNIDIQIKLCEEKLKNLNLAYKRVKGKELKNVLAKFFFAKGKKILPETVVNEKNCIRINDVYNRVIYAHGYPRVVEAGFLDKIISSLGNFDISIHINPYPIETMLINLNKELQKQRADLFSQEQKGIINPSLEIKFSDTKKILEDLQKGHHKLFNVGLYVNCKAKTLEELDLLTKKVESELNSILVIPRVASYRMAQGLKSVSPLGIDELQKNRNVTTEALSAFFPFTSPFLQVDESGVWLGLNKNNIPIIRDVFKLSNPNGVILAQSGGGKSYFAKLLIARYLLNGVKVMVIDPQGEYADLVEHFGGQRVDLSMNSKTMINPLDLMGHDYTEKRLSLMDLMPVMLGELTEPQKSFLDKALTLAYSSKDITEDRKSWKNKPPILSYVVKVLQDMEKKAITFEKTSIRSLINRLSMYSDGVFSFLNTQTNIDFNNNFVCFDIGGMPKQVKPVIMFLVLDYVYMKMRKSLDRKLLIIDEAWSLLSRTEDASYIFEIVKTCRKFNLGLLLINQEVEGLLTSEAGKSVLANSAYTLLMRQKPAVIDSVVKTFHLSEHEKNYLLTADPGNGILILGTEHQELKVIASPKEHEIITTNPEETKAVNEETEVKDINIDLDLNKPYYLKSKLTLEEGNYLVNHGYELSMNGAIGDNRGSMYYVKKNGTESLRHIFLVHNIVDYIKKFTKKVEVFQEVKPDIVFKNKKGEEVAIEVETGIEFDINRKRIQKKIFRLDKEYKNRWHLVLVDAKIKQKYKIYGKEMYTRNDIPRLINPYFQRNKSTKYDKKDKGFKRPVKRKKAKTCPVSKK
ncbi:DUF87 domain-containing protein [Candidatus Woesearchaeota archaeon]|nr:DUF87 domain-containing protein [Candidatus Woesearchaeota archaeon]